MFEPFDTLQDARAEHWLETGDTISAREFYLNHFQSSPASAEPAERPALDASPLDDTGDLSSRASRAMAPRTHASPE